MLRVKRRGMKQPTNHVNEQKEGEGFSNSTLALKERAKRVVEGFSRQLMSYVCPLQIHIPREFLKTSDPPEQLTESEGYSGHLRCLASVAWKSIMARRDD